MIGRLILRVPHLDARNSLLLGSSLLFSRKVGKSLFAGTLTGGSIKCFSNFSNFSNFPSPFLDDNNSNEQLNSSTKPIQQMGRTQILYTLLVIISLPAIYGFSLRQFTRKTLPLKEISGGDLWFTQVGIYLLIYVYFYIFCIIYL